MTDARRNLAFHGFLGLMWTALWFAGLPRPNIDDSFFAGIAMHIAQPGEIANPWCVSGRRHVPGISAEPLLVEPPIYPAALAGRVRVFGLSTASVTAWICALGFGFSACLWALPQTFAVRRTVARLGTMIAGSWISHRGLRPKAFALLRRASGQLLLLCRRDFVGAALGGAPSALAELTHPFWIVFAAPVTALQLRDARMRRETFPKLLAAGS